MSFKNNLLEKIEIDRLADSVVASIGPPGGGKKIDREAMWRLLEKSSFSHEKHRDLDLFITDAGGIRQVLVLDNDLAIYQTGIADVAMRKSPTVKEMLNIRNIVKILNDTDVVISKKEASVRAVQQSAVDRLDLSFDASDIDDIRRQGSASLENGYAEGIKESLDMFAELLGYKNAPPPLQASHRRILGRFTGASLFGPVVIHDQVENRLMLIDREMDDSDPHAMESYHRIISGKEDAPVQGIQVFDFLADAVKRQQSFS